MAVSHTKAKFENFPSSGIKRVPGAKNMRKIEENRLTNGTFCAIIISVAEYAGVVQWLESQPSKLVVWVRFPSPAPTRRKGTIALGGIKRYAPIAQLDRATAF